jgi:hypothetical protein
MGFNFTLKLCKRQVTKIPILYRHTEGSDDDDDDDDDNDDNNNNNSCKITLELTMKTNVGFKGIPLGFL